VCATSATLSLARYDLRSERTSGRKLTALVASEGLTLSTLEICALRETTIGRRRCSTFGAHRCPFATTPKHVASR